DFTFGGEALAVLLGDLARFTEGFGDLLGIACRVFQEGIHATGGIDPDDAGFPHAVVVEDLGDAAGFFDGEDEVLPVLFGAERAATDGARPDRSDERTDAQAGG